MEFRLEKTQDLDSICLLIEDAIVEMEKNGIYQWDDLYPTREDFEEDIRNNNLYVVFEEDRLVAFYVISGEYDEQYNNAEWECEADSAYILHRLCVSPEVQNRGIGKKVLQHIEQHIKDMGGKTVRLSF